MKKAAKYIWKFIITMDFNIISEEMKTILAYDGLENSWKYINKTTTEVLISQRNIDNFRDIQSNIIESILRIFKFK